MIEWNKDDSDRLQEYLHKTDYKIVKYLRSKLPKITGKTFEEAALSGRGRQEAENLLDILEAAASVPRPPETHSDFVDVTKGLPQ